MEELKTVIDFVGSSTGGGATVDTSSVSATSDPLFAIVAILIGIACVAASFFVFARHNKVAASLANGTHVAQKAQTNNFSNTIFNKSTAVLMAVVGFIIAATCLAVCSHNTALAQNSKWGGGCSNYARFCNCFNFR